jgi:hypothetical protein
MDLLTPSLTISLNHNQLQELTINLQPKPSSLTAKDSLHSHSRSPTTAGFGTQLSYIHFAWTHGKIACIVDKACLPHHCLAIDLQLFHASASV